ncbi:TniQ family protein [Cereibacter sphaeroides]|uniref:TniQ family protein n=1 Tax=Cereibacter sphaeroides TaxID=1063 RepID=UPI003AEFF306|nr:TniQ family protein [Cereibacter sphaeroides]MCE6967649.1 TniQ family protein [Cereibacter sphaeroides]MCE6971768.1 TniQ family protein [Cereibacter sphaeroides]
MSDAACPTTTRLAPPPELLCTGGNGRPGLPAGAQDAPSSTASTISATRGSGGSPPPKRAEELEPDVVERIGEIGGLSQDALRDMLSWTGKRTGNVRMTFRGEIFGSPALRNPKVRGCPSCLREDAAAHQARRSRRWRSAATGSFAR